MRRSLWLVALVFAAGCGSRAGEIWEAPGITTLYTDFDEFDSVFRSVATGGKEPVSGLLVHVTDAKVQIIEPMSGCCFVVIKECREQEHVGLRGYMLSKDMAGKVGTDIRRPSAEDVASKRREIEAELKRQQDASD